MESSYVVADQGEGPSIDHKRAIKGLQELAKPGQLMAEFDPAQAGPGG